MSWIESHQELRDHPKKDRLAELLWPDAQTDLSDYGAIGVVHCLWWWAADYAKDGDLSRYSNAQVAKGCRWYGDPATLMAALIEAGFIDSDRHIHDWMETTGAGIVKRETDAARKRAARLAAKRDTVRDRGRGLSVDGPQDVQRTNKQTYQPTEREVGRSSRKRQKRGGDPQAAAAFCPGCQQELTPTELADETLTCFGNEAWWHRQCATEAST